MDDDDYNQSYQEYLKLRETLGKRKTNQHSVLFDKNDDNHGIQTLSYNRNNDDEIHQFILEKKSEYIQDYQRMIDRDEVKEKDKIICFHRDTLNHIRGTFLHLEDRENVGIVLNYKGQYSGREALLLNDYLIYFKPYEPYVYKSKFRKQLEALMNLSSIRVKKKKEEINHTSSEDLFEKIDEIESNDLFEKIEDEE